MTEKEVLRLTKLKEIEEEIYISGAKYICGIDEAGRGPLARSGCSCKLYNAKRFFHRRSK